MYDSLLRAIQEKLTYINSLNASIPQDIAIMELKTMVDELAETV
jgi:hypothetical protein